MRYAVSSSEDQLVDMMVSSGGALKYRALSDTVHSILESRVTCNHDTILSAQLNVTFHVKAGYVFEERREHVTYSLIGRPSHVLIKIQGGSEAQW